MSGRTVIHLWSINHKNAPTEIRELAHIDPEPAVKLMDRLEGCRDCISVIPVSTCNRTEIYLEVKEGVAPDLILASALTEVGANAEIFQSEHVLRLEGEEAIAHLFRVAAGLESMMLGEPQIAGQLKDAYRLARKHHEPGPGMLRAFQGAFRAGKRVRTETRINNGAVSVAFAAVELARKFFNRLCEHKALLVGAGETGSLAARHFLQHDIGHLTVVNRSFDKAGDLARTLNTEHQVALAKQGSGTGLLTAGCGTVAARPWDELAEAMGEADVILSTTGALEPVILPEMVKQAVKARKGNPLFLLDIAVPRDIHPDVSGIGGAFVFGLDDLDEIIAGNLQARSGQVPHAERIIAEEIQEFQKWLADVDLRPTVAEFRAYLEDLKDKQVGFVRKKESDEVAAAVDKSLKQFIKKVLGQSVSTLKNAESTEERDRDLAALRRMFVPETGNGGQTPAEAENRAEAQNHAREREG
jgi:glutamyl-tRNA reductase